MDFSANETYTEVSGSAPTYGIYGNPYTFTGRRLDPETANYYSRHRYYRPSQGRFLSCDPIGIWGDGINLGNGYGYVGGMATKGVDPLGLQMPFNPYMYANDTYAPDPLPFPEQMGILWAHTKITANTVGQFGGELCSIAADAPKAIRHPIITAKEMGRSFHKNASNAGRFWGELSVNPAEEASFALDKLGDNIKKDPYIFVKPAAQVAFIAGTSYYLPKVISKGVSATGLPKYIPEFLRLGNANKTVTFRPAPPRGAPNSLSYNRIQGSRPITPIGKSLNLGLDISLKTRYPLMKGQIVTRWQNPPSTMLRHGDWVMKGGKTPRNWLMAGKFDPIIWSNWVKYRHGRTFLVPESSLKWPTGWEKFKGNWPWGQRRIE